MRSTRFHTLTGISLAVVAMLGVLVCVQPFTGDQALFAAGARQLQHGDVLYRDFWDVKQPGIYGFYLIGGLVVGYREVALHLFELVVLLGFGWFLAATMRTRVAHAWVASLIPLLVVGTYYASAEPLSLGQVESLAGIPLFLTMWSSIRAVDSPARLRWLVLAGAVGGIVAVFKLVLVPIVLAFWILALVASPTTPHDGRTRRFLRDALLIALGCAVPIGATVVYLAAYDQLGTARWTFFEVTPQATRIAGRPLSRLTSGAFKTAALWAFPLALAGYGLVHAIRTGWDRFRVGLVAWIVVGVPIFLVQHWWIYQYAMFIVPVGLLAAFGLDGLLTSWRHRGRTRAAVVVFGGLLLVPLGLRVTSNVGDVVTHGFARNSAERHALFVEIEPDYRAADAWARYLRGPDARRGGVYVLGNPLDLYRSGRRQAVAINGWSPEQYPDEVWDRLTRQILTMRPVELVVDEFSAQIMRERAPATLRLIHRRYHKVGGSGPDSWYRLRTQ